VRRKILKEILRLKILMGMSGLFVEKMSVQFIDFSRINVTSKLAVFIFDF